MRGPLARATRPFSDLLFSPIRPQAGAEGELRVPHPNTLLPAFAPFLSVARGGLGQAQAMLEPMLEPLKPDCSLLLSGKNGDMKWET